MNTAPILALQLSADASTPAVAELVRTTAALVANAQPVRLICAGPGRAALEAEELPHELERTLDGLAELGVTPEALSATELVAALGGALGLVRAAGVREATLLVIDAAWLAAAPEDPERALAALASAGQVILDR